MTQKNLQKPGKVPYLRIATEEAFCPSEMLDIYRNILKQPHVDPGFQSLMGFYMSSPSERAQHIMRCLVDLDQVRIGHMDDAGIDMQVIALTSPGVQAMDRDLAVSFAKVANDELAEGVRRHPDRLVGMIAVAPQDPAEAAKEIQRGVNQLGMNSVVINSHTHGEYLSDQKFWEIFEAAQAHDTPIYLHPNTPPANMIGPFLDAGLDGAVYGFGVETGLHALRLITSGVFDRFPQLQIILGHMGEALPFWAYRLDYMHAATVRSNRYAAVQPLKRKPSDYLRDNFHITNSGVAWPKAIEFTQSVVSEDRVLYAMDYPYQYAIDEVNALDGMDMNPSAKKKFFQTNAQALFKIPTPKTGA
ncbi:amidohydrolase family protein [Limnohabitans sp.]|jgi:5-carboxyvanillate decarboxylase|uniref:amidohydrolase family protein n=1 Tax=Limnohabitans sp. TaxID=1907725 RepID=UPI0038B8DB24